MLPLSEVVLVVEALDGGVQVCECGTFRCSVLGSDDDERLGQSKGRDKEDV